MLFFLIVPAWLLCVAVGIVLLFFRALRRAGLYIIVVPTSATISSLMLSSVVLYLGPRILSQPARSWYGVVLIAAYVATAAVGALLGSIAGFLFLRKVQPIR